MGWPSLIVRNLGVEGVASLPALLEISDCKQMEQ